MIITRRSNIILGELNRALDDWCEIEIDEDNGDANRIPLSTKSKVEYFNEHLGDRVSFITQENNKIIIFTERY